MSMLEDRENTRRVEMASSLLAAIAADDPWKEAEAWFTQFTEGRDKVAQSHMFRVKKAERELLGRRRALEESPSRFWLEYDPMGIYPEGGARGAEFWLRVDCAATLFSVAAAGDDDRRDRCVWPLDRAGKRLLKACAVDRARNRELKRRAVQSVETATPLLCGLSRLAQTIRRQAPRLDGRRLVVGWGREPFSLETAAAVLMEALEAAALDKSEQNRGLVSWGGMSSVSMAWAAAETLRAAQAVGGGALTPAQGAELLADYAGENLIPELGARAGRHLDELMEYAAWLEQDGMALADGKKEGTGADG